MYKDQVIYAIDKRFEIYDIIMAHKTQDATEEERQNYYPVSIYCDKCGKGVRVGHNVVDGKKVRVCRKCGAEI